MDSRSENNKPKSRVERNRELYQELYSENYFQNDEPKELEKTNEIDIERVKELLRGREMYRKEMKLREINMAKPKSVEEQEEKPVPEEKDYDINAYLNKVSSTRETEPYHKIDPEINKIEPEISQEPNLDDLKDLGDTTLSLGLFDALEGTKEVKTEEIEKTDEVDDNTKTLFNTQTNSFFTDSIKLSLTDEDEDEEKEKSSTLVKVIMTLLILVVIALVVFIIIM